MLIQPGAINVHTLGWPGCSDPSPFGRGLATDNRRFPRWEHHNPARDAFDFDTDFNDGEHGYYKNASFAVDEWRQHGLNTLLVLQCDKRPAWATLEDDAAWTAWVTEACKRWRPFAVEFVNEPSGRITDHSWLVRMFKLGRSAALKVGPVEIVGPSCESITAGGNGVQFTKAFLAAGGAAQIDVLGLHLYPYGAPNKEPISILDQMAYLQAELGSAWSGPIWNTESGNRAFSQQSRETQLRWVRRHGLLPILGGCEKSFIYAYNDDDYGWYESPHYREVCNEVMRIKALEGNFIADCYRSATGAVIRMDDGELIEV